jgi:hypothetical protein
MTGTTTGNTDPHQKCSSRSPPTSEPHDRADRETGTPYADGFGALALVVELVPRVLFVAPLLQCKRLNRIV